MEGISFGDIEIIIITGIVVFQFIYSYRLKLRIDVFNKIFDSKLVVNQGYVHRETVKQGNVSSQNIEYNEESITTDFVKITVVQHEGDSICLKNICNDINNYLLNNLGATVNFGIIKDIIDREVEVVEEEISNSLPIPLYLGLAATMLGVIFGFISFGTIMGSSNAIDASDSLNIISPLINGVKIAMVGSLVGLLCTTVLSSFYYKKAKATLQKQKNILISYLQSNLLPDLLNSETTGLSGLKNSLDHFAREATKISENVYQAVSFTGVNINAQNNLLDKIKEIDVQKITTANLEIFDRLERNLSSLTHFTQYMEEMKNVASSLREFGQKISNVDLVIQSIDGSLKRSVQLSDFLTSHLHKLESHGNLALNAVDFSDAHFRDAIEQLKQITYTKIQSINEINNKTEVNLREVYKEIGQQLNQVTAEHIEKFSLAYTNAVPQFEHLQHLESLSNNNQELVLQIKELRSENTAINEKLISVLNSNNGTNSMNEAFLSKLERAITDLSISRSNGNHSIEEPNQSFLQKTWFWIQFSAAVSVIVFVIAVLFNLL